MWSKSEILFDNKNQRFWHRKIFWQVLYAIAILEISYEFVLYSGIVLGNSDSKLNNAAHRSFFMAENLNKTIDGNLSTFDYILIGVFGLSLLNKFIAAELVHIFLLVVTFAVWLSSKTFRKNLNKMQGYINASKTETTALFRISKSSNLAWRQVLENYNQVKELCRLSSDALGNLYLWDTGLFVMTISRVVDVTIFKVDLESQLPVFFYVGVSVLTLILASEIVVNVLQGILCFA